MKKLVGGLAIAVAILLPGAAFAGGSTDAALGLGAFAVFNQILGGVGIFGRPTLVAAPAPVVYAPPPAVYAPLPSPPVYAAPPAVVYAPAPLVIVRPVPVFVRPAPVFVRPAPVFVRPVPVYGHERGHGNPHWQRTQWGHRGR
jgi:hypothetical protein